MNTQRQPSRAGPGIRLPIVSTFLIAIHFLAWPILASAQPDQIARQSIFEEVGQVSANAFLEDHLGFMWIGARRLYRYDGYELRPALLRADDSTFVNTGTVNALLEDRRERIWIAAEKGLFRYDRRTNRCVQLFTQAYAGNHWGNHGYTALVEDAEGRIWIGSHQYLLVMDEPDSDQVRRIVGIDLPYQAQLRLGVSKIIVDQEEQLYVATGQGLYQVTEHAGSRLLSPPEFTSSQEPFVVAGMSMDAAGDLWLATTRGLWRFDTHNGVFSRIPLPNGVGEVTSSVVVGEDGTIWVGISQSGLYAFREGNWTAHIYDPQNIYGIAGDRVRRLAVDRFGGVWASSVFVTQKLNPKQQRFPFYQITPGPKKYDNYVHRIMQDSLGGFWYRLLRKDLGFSSGMDAPLEIVLSPPARSQIEEIKNFCSDSEGNVWVITLTHGLYKFAPGSKVPEAIDLGDSLRTAAPLVIMADRNEDRYLWFSSSYGLCRVDRFTYQRRWFRPSEEMEGVLLDNISNMTQSANGDIWCTVRFSDHLCIAYLDGDSKRFVAGLHQPEHPEDIAISATHHYRTVPGNKIWIGVREGLLIVDQDSREVDLITTADGLPVVSVLAIAPDREGNIWFSGPTSICRYDGLEYQCYDGRHDIEGFNAHSAAVGPDGCLSFGGKNGVYAFYPEEIEFIADTFVPRVFLTDLRVFDQSYWLPQALDITKQIVLTHEDNVISFEYAAPHFFHTQRITYQHRLEPLESRWTDKTGADRRAVYNKLAPGRYIFRVRAVKGEGGRTDGMQEISVQLIIRPPWYKTTLAVVMFVVVITGVLLVLRRLLPKRYRDAPAGRNSSAVPDPTPEDTFLQQAGAVVREHLADDSLNVKKLCRLLGMSRTKLHRKFKDLTGQSTTYFINTVRIEHAKKLLINSDLPIKTIAFQCGFGSPDYFRRVFRERQGCSPSEYRANTET